MERCFASISQLEEAETAYAEKQETTHEYAKLKDFIENKGATEYKKYYIYSINEPGNKPYHFVAKFRSENKTAKDLYLSHYSQGLNLLTLRDKTKGKPPSYPYYENEYVTLIKEGEFQEVPTAKDIYDSVLLWWYQNDQIKRTTKFPGSCSGVVSCIIGKYDKDVKKNATSDKYLQDLSKLPGNPFKFIETVRVRFRVRKVAKKSNRKSNRKSKRKSVRKSKKVKKYKAKSVRKSVRKLKKSKKSNKSNRKSVRKSAKKIKKSVRKSVRKVVSRK